MSTLSRALDACRRAGTTPADALRMDRAAQSRAGLNFGRASMRALREHLGPVVVAIAPDRVRVGQQPGPLPVVSQQQDGSRPPLSPGSQSGAASARAGGGSKSPTGWAELDRSPEATSAQRGTAGGQPPLIISRHPGAVAWLAVRGVTGEVVTHATPEMVAGRDVVGVLPFNLAALATSVTSIDLPGITPEQRGRDLSPAEMDGAGATLIKYRVERL